MGKLPTWILAEVGAEVPSGGTTNNQSFLFAKVFLLWEQMPGRGLSVKEAVGRELEPEISAVF